MWRLSFTALQLTLVLAATSGCVVPGMGTLFEKGVSEVVGGRGEAREIRPFAQGRVLDRFRAVKVLPVTRSADAGPIPTTLPKVVEVELRNALSDAKLFQANGGGPVLLIRARLTTHWTAAGWSQAVSAHSEILARVEFLEDTRSAPLGVYYVRGVSYAIARKSDEQLGRGLASAVIDVIQNHRTPPLNGHSPGALDGAHSPASEQ